MRQWTSLQEERSAQVMVWRDEEVERLIRRIRRSESLPKLGYHLARHAADFGAGGADEYVEALRGHLARPDLRAFTYLRTKDHKPMWELIAPDDGTAAMYHEERGSLWSFFRPVNRDVRMRVAEVRWLEAIRTPTGWRFVERWRWKP